MIFADYMGKFYKDIFWPTIDKYNIKTILEGGDFYDRRKFINYQILASANEYWWNPLMQREIEDISIVGNHNCPFRTTNSLNNVDLLAPDSLKIKVYTDPAEITVGGLDILLLPWVNDENHEATLRAIAKSKSKVVYGHLEIAGFFMNKGQLCDHGSLDKRLLHKFKAVYSGHFHHKNIDGNITYLGAPYEMTWSDYDDEKGFHIFDTETFELERIVNPIKMFDKFIYNDIDKDTEAEMKAFNARDKFIKIVVEKKQSQQLFDSVYNSITAQNPHGVTIIDNTDGVDLDTIPDTESIESEDTLSFINSYLDNLTVSESIDKTRLRDTLISLYNESVNLSGI